MTNRKYIKKAEQTLINIRMMREVRKMSQTQVAKTLGVSQNAYSKFELGYTVIKLEHIYALADIFDVGIHEIIIA